MNLAPIVLFVYNRPWHTKQTVEALQKNELAKESELFIYSDEAKNEDAGKSVDEVRQYIETIDGFKKVIIIKREKNWGLANSIIDGVTKTLNEYRKVIVLEDDLVTSPYFLKFMNEALEFYKDDERIFVISGYSPPIKVPDIYKKDVYLTYRSSSWGWATWKDEWNTVEWKNSYYKLYMKDKKVMNSFAKKGGKDRPAMLKLQLEGEINSWAIRRGFSQFLQKKYTLYPKVTLIKNIGHDGSGIHCGVNTSLNKIEVDNTFLPILKAKGIENNKIHKEIYEYHTVSFIKRVMNKLKRIIEK